MRNIKTFSLLVLCLISLIGKGQKTIEIPNNQRDSMFFDYKQKTAQDIGLDNLISSNDSLCIRIWMNHHTVQIQYSGSIKVKLNSRITKDNIGFEKISRTITLNDSVAQLLGNTLLNTEILELPDDNYAGIDGTQYIFEISTPNNYRIFSYWSPGFINNNQNRKKASEIIDTIYKIVDIEKVSYNFFQSLPPGNYRWGLTKISIDHFIHNDVNELSVYRTVERRIQEELGLNDNSSHLTFPLILVDNNPCFLKDLNKIKLKKVKNITILSPSDKSAIIYRALYGPRGATGVVIIQTKKRIKKYSSQQ